MKAWRDKEVFKARVLEWADKLGVQTRAVALRPMRNKWASCSTAGNLNFNAELIELDRDIGDYVIVHELLHFSVPNHGRLWKSLMRAHLGDYEQIEARLGKVVRSIKEYMDTRFPRQLPPETSSAPSRAGVPGISG
jgi:predicted metal-dependent hydrolase